MEYDAFREEKLKYEDIEIPDELLLMVRETIAADRRKKAVRQRARIIRMVGSVAAILFLCLTIGVNSSYAFAETVVKIPVVKSVAKAVIVRSYKADIIALDEQNSKPPERVPDSQQTPVETLPAVSGNDIVSENEESEQPVSQEPSEVPEGLDAWKSDMTLERFKEITELYAPEMEDRYAQEPEKLRTILLAEVAEKDISLYGYHEDGRITGTALRVKDTYQYFDWIYMNESKKLPDISVTDADGDGEEEIVVLLYNGSVLKKEISNEDIASPEDTTAKDATEEPEKTEADSSEKEIMASDSAKQTSAEGSANVAGSVNSKTAENAADTSDTVKPDTSADEKTAKQDENTKDTAKTTVAEETAESITQDTISGDNLTKEETTNTVSGNDIQVPSTGEEKPKPEQQAGELWVISTKEETWTAALLSANDYESQILHQLKAEYNEETGSLRLYLLEEPLGNSIKLPSEQKSAYEKVNLAPERKFTIKDGIRLNFKLEAIFQNENKQKTVITLPVNLQAEIHLEAGSLSIENICVI